LIIRLCIYLDCFLTNDFIDYSPTINANYTRIIRELYANYTLILLSVINVTFAKIGGRKQLRIADLFSATRIKRK